MFDTKHYEWQPITPENALFYPHQNWPTCDPSITSPGDVRNCWSTSAGFNIPEPIVTRNWLVCGLHIQAECRLSASVCLLLTHSPSGVGGADGGLAFLQIFFSSKLGLVSVSLWFCITFSGSWKTWDGWVGIGASGGTACSGCHGWDSACNTSWVFSNRGSKGGWEGSCIDCTSESGSADSKGILDVAGSVCWIIWEKGSFAVGATMESKKLCPSTSPLVIVGDENKSLRVRFTLSADTPWISTLCAESSGSLVCLVFVGLGSGELSFIHWPSG